jgi:hypothetical protein
MRAARVAPERWFRTSPPCALTYADCGGTGMSASSGATKDYGFSQKNNWRRTQWNQILVRTRGLEKTQPILYLAGPDDNDRHVATSKGVPSQNLIAIDRDRANVERVKSGSNPALHSDIESVIKSWPSHRKVCAVMLDFCSGLENRYFLDLREPLARTPFAGAAISINFQRGRDKSSEDARQRLQSRRFMDLFSKVPQHVRFISVWSQDEKNRAAMFMMSLILDLVDGVLFTLGAAKPRDVDPGVRARLFMNIVSVLKPTFHSYQSVTETPQSRRVVVFDSVVFSQIQLQDGSGIQTEIEDQIDYGRDPLLARRISATLAVRTARMRGAI